MFFERFSRGLNGSSKFSIVANLQKLLNCAFSTLFNVQCPKFLLEIQWELDVL